MPDPTVPAPSRLLAQTLRSLACLSLTLSSALLGPEDAHGCLMAATARCLRRLGEV